MTRYVIAHRLRDGFRSLLAGGLVLGLVLGLSLASLAAARSTASAYSRVLDAADAEDGVTAHAQSPEAAAAVLDALPSIERHVYQAGFVGFIEGADPALTGGTIASGTDAFAIELPTLEAGRLPVPDRADEVFVNSFLAEKGRIDVGDDLTLLVLDPATGELVPTSVTVTGIGALPREAVVDETALGGIMIMTRAFHEAHEDLRAYANSRLWLDDPGALADLAPTLSDRGFEISETRAQERRAVEEALRPTITLLNGLGVLAALATIVVVGQVAQRQHDRWRGDDAVLSALGADRWDRVVVYLAAVAVEVAIAIVVAAGVMLAISPRAPIGPMHDLDPAQGVHLDLTVAIAGALALLLVLAATTLGVVLRGERTTRPVERPSGITAAAQRPSSLAGLSLAVRSRRRAGVRLAVAATAGAALLTAVATVVVSGRSLVDTPSKYGVNFDVLALTAFADQTDEGVARTFGVPEVVAATSFTNATLLLEGQTVPGLGLTPVRGTLGPTILEGEAVRHDDEVVLGIDTAQRMGLEIGDEVTVQAAAAYDGGPPPPPRSLRVVGLGTFAAISQQGTDEARLGTGALTTIATLHALRGSADDLPEWTVAKLAGGRGAADDFIDANPSGIDTTIGIATRWFTDARPAELVQLDATGSVLLGAVSISVLLFTVLLAQGAWSRTRSSRTELSILRALGFSRRQLAHAVAWQPIPSAAMALVVGMPIGFAAGRLAYRTFARSIAVVDDPTSPLWLVAALIATVLSALVVAVLLAARAAGHVSSAATLRDAAGRRA